MDRVKRDHADKIALSGVLVLSLLVAYFVGIFRSIVTFSKAIELPYGALSVSMPAGRSWKGMQQWQYEDNRFSISSFFDSGSSHRPAYVRCQYLLAAIENNCTLRLAHKAVELKGQIKTTGVLQKAIEFSDDASAERSSSFVTINWAHIQTPGSGRDMSFDVFYGLAELLNGRFFEIEVSHPGRQPKVVKRLFERVAARIVFRDNLLLETGSELVAEIKAAGLRSFLDGEAQQEYFIIKDSSDSPIGFTTDILVASQTGAANQPDIQGASSVYVRRRQEQVMFFECSNNLDRFAFRSEADSPDGKSGTQVVMEANDIVAVSGYSRFSLLGALKKGRFGHSEQLSYRFGPAAIPDMAIGIVMVHMLETNRHRFFIDILSADGTIQPVKLCVSSSHHDSGADHSGVDADKQGEHELMIEFMDGSDFSQQIFLDREYQVIKKAARYDDAYTFQRVSAEDIVKNFPERADHIRVTDRLLDKSQL